MKKLSILFLSASILLAACLPAQPNLEATPTQVVNQIATPTAAIPPLDPTATTTVAPLPVPETATPIPAPQVSQQFIAYESNGQLLVTSVTGGVQGGTTQYTTAGVNDQVTDIAWSPSGEFIAFTSPAQGEPHLFY